MAVHAIKKATTLSPLFDVGLFLNLLSLLGAVTSGSDKAIPEYCQLEKFEATCSQNQVIVMEMARYGRMRLGRCVRRSYGYLGCAADVLAYVDRRCSGRQKCEFHVADLHGSQPCPNDLTPFLEAQYTCLDVTKKSPQVCSASSPIVINAPSGFLANSLTMETGQGSPTCPWKLKVLPGQRLNITLVNFARVALQNQALDQRGSMKTKICFQYAILKEVDYMRTVTECEGGARTSHTYLSTSNEVEIQILTKSLHQIYFLLSYQAVGCPNPTLPGDLWYKRTGETALVTCNVTSQSWRIICTEGEWFGEVGNCTNVSTKSWKMGQLFEGNSFPYSILIVVAIGVALGVFLGGLLLVCASRYFRKKRRSQHRAGSYPQDIYIPEQSKMMMTNYDETLQRKHVTSACDYPKTTEFQGQGQTTLDQSGGVDDCRCPYSAYASLPPPGYPRCANGPSQLSAHALGSRYDRKDSV